MINNFLALPIFLAAPINPDGIAAWAVNIMESLGGIGVAFLIALENLFPPLPSEIILPLAGFTASLGTKFGLISAIIWATAGSVTGAIALYLLAYAFGRERTRHYLGKIPLFKVSDIDKTEQFFDRHSHAVVFFGRMIPVFRSLISLPAGVIGMNFPLFLLFTAAGSAIWNTVLIGAGYALGENWHIVEDYVGIFSKLVLGALLLAAFIWIGKRLWERRKTTPPADSRENK